MNQESLVSFLSELAGPKADLKKLDKLIQLSSRALELLQLKSKTSDPKKLEEVNEAMSECQNELTQEYEKLLAQLGLNKGDLERYVQDPQNFSHNQWEMIQNFRGTLEKQAQVRPQPELKEKASKRHSLPGSAKKWMTV